MTARTDRTSQWILFTIVAVGIAIRVIVYLHKRSLWLDEATLAANLVSRSYAGLLQRLEYIQVAPPLFLFISKFIYGVLGQIEYSLRLFPLVCGCLTLFLLGRILSRETPKFFGLCAVSFFAFDLAHIDWATSFKQYASDEFAATLILYTTVYWEPLTRSRRYLAATLLPALVWLSYTSSFVIVGLALVAAYDAFRTGKRDRYAALAILLVSTIIFSSSLYLLGVQHSMRHQDQVRNFSEGFPHSPYVAWLFGSVGSLFATSSGVDCAPALALIIVSWGAIAVARSRHFHVSLLAVGALSAAFGASLLGVYPLCGGRLGTYWAGMSVFLLAYGLFALYGSFRSEKTARGVKALAVFLVAAAIYGTVCGASWLIAREEMRLVVRDLAAWTDEEDIPFFVSCQASASFKVYGGSLLEGRVFWLLEWEIRPKELYDRWIDAGCPDRLWLVLSHDDFRITESALDELARHCEVKERIRHWDSAAYFVEIKPKEAWPPSPPESNEIY